MISFKHPTVKTKVGWRERVIRTNFVKHFLAIFRDTQDIHRVFAVILPVLLLSHSWFLKDAAQVSLVAARLNFDERLWLMLAGLVVAFMFSWAVFSSPFNPALYFRQLIVGAWTLLIHRLVYGLTQLGTADFYVLAFTAFISFLPFALTGLKIEQFFQRIQENREAKLNQQPPVIIEEKENETVSPEGHAA